MVEYLFIAKGFIVNDMNGFYNKFILNNQLTKYYGDKRNLSYIKFEKKEEYKCVYCGNKADTKEHIPPKIFLDEPFQSPLAILPACSSCNRSYSEKEQYLACLVEYLKSNLCKIDMRDKIYKALSVRHTLREGLEKVTYYTDKQISYIEYDIKIVEDVIFKLAIGHAAYFLSMLYPGKPYIINHKFIVDMTDEEIYKFNIEPRLDIVPEIGSRGSIFLCLAEGVPFSQWNVVQENQYRFLAYHNNSTHVRIVIGEFLFAEVIWQN